jgi:hypothetical protein
MPSPLRRATPDDGERSEPAPEHHQQIADPVLLPPRANAADTEEPAVTIVGGLLEALGGVLGLLTILAALVAFSSHDRYGTSFFLAVFSVPLAAGTTATTAAAALAYRRVGAKRRAKILRIIAAVPIAVSCACLSSSILSSMIK